MPSSKGSKKAPIELQAAMFLMAKSKISILECQAVAKDMGLGSSMTFDLVGPKGSKHCRWVDAHYGVFEIIGDSKAIHIKQVQYIADIHCENMGVSS